MNKTTLLALIMIVAAGVIFMNASKDVSTYSNFREADSTGDRVKVVGVLSKSKPMEYLPEKNPNIFKFYMTDNKGEEKQVVLAKAKPQDFERSEQIVVTGTMKDNQFYADEILMKCPSKYKEEEITLRKGS
ncbi:MAG TPA: cytochrome c maturation protein CcmE [Saprospiraceae bacterium]|nr:cytochrome c maturation protein CcmE [Saprospiraceae bacterium]HRG22506.1 cytochrome c maturation protein CcmE [Saprospiraceae bacterium]HRG65085.1 cytochrome c maturation protein CcmE [Saprospiraceae bacterium]